MQEEEQFYKLLQRRSYLILTTAVVKSLLTVATLLQ